MAQYIKSKPKPKNKSKKPKQPTKYFKKSEKDKSDKYKVTKEINKRILEATKNVQREKFRKFTKMGANLEHDSDSNSNIKAEENINILKKNQ